jgi:TetR/AcrR family fatty acid metabolism transcriptional regulator
MTDGRSRRAEEAREQRRRQILDAALTVFAEKGYHGTAISDLVKTAGVARGTFYLYFDSKEAVFQELLSGLLLTLRHSVRGVDTSGGVSAEAQLLVIVSEILRTVDDNRPLTRIIFREAVGLDDEIDALLQSFYDELLGYIERALHLGAVTGLLRPLAEPGMVATCILGSLRGMVQRYVLLADEAVDIDRVAGAVVDHNLRGLLAG